MSRIGRDMNELRENLRRNGDPVAGQARQPNSLPDDIADASYFFVLGVEALLSPQS